MQIKKIALAGAAAALIGGFAFAPNATAAEGECDPIEEAAPLADIVVLYGESPETAGEGCLVAEGSGGVPVNPLDDGHTGVYDNDGTPALYGDCSPREDGAGFTPWDPTAGDTDTAACAPGPA